MPRFAIKAMLNGNGPIEIVGRNAWCLLMLVMAGEKGCTPISRPAPRWSHYVFCLRRMGFLIETIDEPHGGAFSGTHARYVLRSQVDIVEGAEAPL